MLNGITLYMKNNYTKLHCHILVFVLKRLFQKKRLKKK